MSFIEKAVAGCGLTKAFLLILSLQPLFEVVISLIAKLPAAEYDFEGEIEVDVVLSPNFQRLVYDPELMVLLLVRLKVLPRRHCELSLILNPALSDVFAVVHVALKPAAVT